MTAFGSPSHPPCEEGMLATILSRGTTRLVYEPQGTSVGTAAAAATTVSRRRARPWEKNAGAVREFMLCVRQL